MKSTKDIYESLNNIDIDINEFEEMEVNDIEKQKVKNTLKKSINEKGKYKRVSKVASIGILSVGILSSGFMFNEEVWASVKDIFYSIEKILHLKEDEFENYKYEINKTVEDSNVAVTYKSMVIDEGNLILEISVDDSQFDPLEDFTKQEQDDWYVDKWGEDETFVSLMGVQAYVNGEKRSISGGGEADYQKRDKDSNGVTNTIAIVPINEVGKDEFNVKYVSKDQFPNKIDKDRIYNLELKVEKIHLASPYYKEEKVSYAGVIKGDWSIDLEIKGEDLIKSTLNYDEYTIDKSIEVNINENIKEINFDSIKVSPMFIKLKYTIDNEENIIGEDYFIDIKLKNENGEEYQTQEWGYTENSENTSIVEGIYRNIFINNEKIKIEPVIVQNEGVKNLGTETIEIKLD